MLARLSRLLVKLECEPEPSEFGRGSCLLPMLTPASICETDSASYLTEMRLC